MVDTTVNHVLVSPFVHKHGQQDEELGVVGVVLKRPCIGHHAGAKAFCAALGNQVVFAHRVDEPQHQLASGTGGRIGEHHIARDNGIEMMVNDDRVGYLRIKHRTKVKHAVRGVEVKEENKVSLRDGFF